MRFAMQLLKHAGVSSKRFDDDQGSRRFDPSIAGGTSAESLRRAKTKLAKTLIATPLAPITMSKISDMTLPLSPW